MIAFTPCKINIGLHVTGKRSDGYHNIESLFYPVPLYDILEVIEDKEADAGSCRLSVSGLPIDADLNENLVTKAYRLLAGKYRLPSVQVHLHKVIPMGAGLGGGSSNGAYMLRLLNQKFELGIEPPELIDYAACLGSDCPFFILNSPAIARSRGEVLQKFPDILNGYWIYLVHPGIHVSTAQAFRLIQLKNHPLPVDALQTLKPNSWNNLIINDFDDVISSNYSEIAEIRHDLFQAGALYVSLTGSGSAVYGIFSQEPPKIQWPEPYFTHVSPFAAD